MTPSTTEIENELVVWALEWLQQRLPASWDVERMNSEPGGPDAIVEVRATHVFARIAVEGRSSLVPRDVDRMLGGLGRMLRALSPQVPILVVAPWLSPRTQDLLRAEGLNYLDRTGNAFLRLDNPALYIETQGAARDPAPRRRWKARVRGPKASRLIRTLVDVQPPYGVRELADAAGLTSGYVSQLLDTLDQEALVTRSRRGRVEDTDVEGLVRRWAESYDVFQANAVASYIAPQRAPEALQALARTNGAGRASVTGSFAAVRFATVAAPALLAVYCDDAETLAEELGLLRTDQGANVVLLAPFDPIVWERTEEQDGVTYVAPSQAAVDCLTGTGRMPAEGEAVLDWMLADEGRWRAAGLPG